MDAVAAVAQCFARHPDVDVVYGHAALVNADGRILQMLWAPPFRYGLLRLTNFIVQPAAFIRRSALGATLVDETFHYAMDYELWLRLGQDRRIAKINHVIAVDRNYPERKSVARTRPGGDRLCAAATQLRRARISRHPQLCARGNGRSRSPFG